MSTDQTPTSTPYLIADGRDADGAPILLVPGFWLGSWCWTEVALALAARGRRAVAVDLAGHGLRARRPAAATARPFDAAALANEPSPVAGVTLDDAAELLSDQIRRTGRGGPVTVVAHSLAGPVLTRVAQDTPHLIARAVYLAALHARFGHPSTGLHRRPGERRPAGDPGHGRRPRRHRGHSLGRRLP